MGAPIVAAKTASMVVDRRQALTLAGFAGFALMAGAATAASVVGASVTAAIKGGATGGAACLPDGCAVSATTQQAAQRLVAEMDAGKLHFISTPSNYAYQVRAVAGGDGSCPLQLPILQLIEIACGMFSSVGISDLNRACTGDLPSSSSYSAHWVGRAIDFTSFDGQLLTGGDANSVAYLRAIEGLLPAGSQVGQVYARQATGRWWPMAAGISQIDDADNHLHVDVGRHTTAGLNL